MMKKNNRKITNQIACSLFIVLTCFFIVYIGQSILIPLALATIFAILVKPLYNFFHFKMRIAPFLASLFTVVCFILVFIMLALFLSWQIGDMMSDWDKIQYNLSYHLQQLQEMLSQKLHVSQQQQVDLINRAASNSGRAIIGGTLLSISDLLSTLLLIPIYLFLLLYYQSHFIAFLHRLFGNTNQEQLQVILPKVRIAVQSYITGLFGEMVIVGALTAIGYSIIGLNYAILLGVITALLNLIPYVGIAAACLLSMVASLSGSTDLSIIIGVVSVNLIVQIVDNNLLVPFIVSAKVKINALISILAILIGGALAGVAGMFLAIPVTAVIKVIFDHVAPLQAWGFLMGDKEKSPKNTEIEPDQMQL